MSSDPKTKRFSENSRFLRVLLFDIDGTLIRTSRSGRAVMQKALEHVHGTAGEIDAYPFAGKTDRKIIFDVLANAGFTEEEIIDSLPEIYQQMAKWGEKIFSVNGLSLCVGVMEMIERLNLWEGAFLGLQTGNIQSTANQKLNIAGLGTTFFSFGAFGSDSVNRGELIPIALGRLSKRLGYTLPLKDVIVIGDTPADIASAKVNGVQSLAVATGTFSSETLVKFDPDHLLENFSDTESVISLLLG